MPGPFGDTKSLKISLRSAICLLKNRECKGSDLLMAKTMAFSNI